ncbi:MAG: hypothetical protein LBN06_02175 [Prevotellaceae bacterium]|jgi:hypothetical protein|nr:hypothetical protein [Prevotellaceae bacterium]
MKNRYFIITSLQSWDIEIGSTIKNTALELSKQNRVLYINPPMDFATRLRALFHRKDSVSPAFKRRMEVLRGDADPIRTINHNLWVVDCPFVLLSVSKLPAWLFDTFNRRNNRKIGRLIVKEAVTLGFKNYIHLIDTDIFRSRYLKEFIRPAVSVYYRRTDVLRTPYWQKYGRRVEQVVIQQSDVMIVAAKSDIEQFRPYNSNIHLSHVDANTGICNDIYSSIASI